MTPRPAVPPLPTWAIAATPAPRPPPASAVTASTSRILHHGGIAPPRRKQIMDSSSTPTRDHPRPAKQTRPPALPPQPDRSIGVGEPSKLDPDQRREILALTATVFALERQMAHCLCVGRAQRPGRSAEDASRGDHRCARVDRAHLCRYEGGTSQRWTPGRSDGPAQVNRRCSDSAPLAASMRPIRRAEQLTGVCARTLPRTTRT